MDAAKIETIARKADARKGTGYQHFSDKGEIICSLADEQVETSTKPLKQAIDMGLCTFLVEPQFFALSEQGCMEG